MKKNMGSADRLIRIPLAVAIAILHFTDHVIGTTAILSAMLAIIFATTSLMGFCPLYLPFRISTKKHNT